MSETVVKPNVVAWLKPWCGWSAGVRAVLKKYDIPFEERDIINNPEAFEEMILKTGQTKQPSLDINGRILADVSGEEVEAWLLREGLVSHNAAVPEVPINQPCAHEIPAEKPLEFRR